MPHGSQSQIQRAARTHKPSPSGRNLVYLDEARLRDQIEMVRQPVASQARKFYAMNELLLHDFQLTFQLLQRLMPEATKIKLFELRKQLLAPAKIGPVNADQRTQRVNPLGQLRATQPDPRLVRFIPQEIRPGLLALKNRAHAMITGRMPGQRHDIRTIPASRHTNLKSRER